MVNDDKCWQKLLSLTMAVIIISVVMRDSSTAVTILLQPSHGVEVQGYSHINQQLSLFPCLLQSAYYIFISSVSIPPFIPWKDPKVYYFL